MRAPEIYFIYIAKKKKTRDAKKTKTNEKANEKYNEN